MILFAGLLRRLVAPAATALVHRLLGLLRLLAALEIRARPAMPAAAVPAIAVMALAVLAVAVLLAALVRVGILLRRSAGDERGQAANVAGILSALLGLRLVRLIVRPRLMLLVMLRLLALVVARLLLMMLPRLLLLMLRLLLVMLLLWLRVVRLILSVRPKPVFVAIVEAVVAAALRRALLLRLLALLRLLIVIRVLLPKLFLRRRDQPEVMLGVLIVILGRDRVAGALRVTRELDVLLRDVGGRAANFHIGPVRLVNPCQRILALAAMMTAATPHALLTVSHGVSVRQPLIDCGSRRDLSNLKVPRAEANCPGPPSAEHYLPTPRRISRAVARTSALLSRVSKRSQCCAFRSLAYLW